MSEYARRNVLRTAVAIGTGAVTGAGAAAKSGATDGAGGWSSVRGDPGNTGFVLDATGPKSPVAVAWTYDRGGRFAVVDGTAYLATDDGSVHAIDATDGTREWETEISTASGEAAAVAGSPAVADETVFVTTREWDPDVVALDAATGDLRWRENELGYETNQAPVVANGLAFVVADKVLYALEARSGERRWRFDPEPMTTEDGQKRGDSLQREAVAVANGTVFAVSNNRLFARAVETGGERWTDAVDDWRSSTFSGRPIAADDVVAVVRDDTVTIYDAETGERSSSVPVRSLDVLTADRVYAVTGGGATDRSTVAGYEPTGDPVWQPSDDVGSIASAVVGPEAVYAGLEKAGDAAGVAALDRADGSRQWRDDGEATPGFTAATSVAGGALLLEWLRRRTATEQ